MIDTDAVLAANQAFYDAHETRDMPMMRALWLADGDVVCTHPGWPTLRGRDDVLVSWRQIFDGPGETQFILTDVHVTVHGDTAWVTLSENIVDRSATGAVAATNVFVRVDGAWRLAVHHGSPVIMR